MKIEHITFGGTSLVRDTDIILSSTIEHFRAFEKGNIETGIDRTNFICKVTVENNIAFFDLKINRDIFSTTFCCFAKEDKEPVMLYATNLAKVLQAKKMITQPHEDLFMVTFIINPFVVKVSDMQIAGEIELYIYNAIMRGLKL